MHSPENNPNEILGTNSSVWDLSELYSGPNDPKIDTDLAEFRQLAERFAAKYRGRLDELLSEAINDYRALSTLAEQPIVFLELCRALDTGEQTIKKRLAEVQELLSIVSGEHLTFLEIELASLSEDVITRQAEANPIVKHHLPWLKKIRLFRDHLLSEPVEQALTKREPFGPSSWAQFYNEVEADLRVVLPSGELTLPQALHELTENKNQEHRTDVLKSIHDSLGGFFLKYSTETLMATVRSKSLEDQERGYAHPMALRNLSNLLDDHTVEALHKTVADRAAPAMLKYYRLKAAHLGIERLAWSDRSAPLPFHNNTIIPFFEARQLVESAYESFSPTLARLVKDQFDNHRVDAPHQPGKQGGAFNLSFCLPDGRPLSFTLLNYLGSPRDVATLAHELGHGVHGLLAGEAQGSLMQHAPIAYAETASIFGEMITFDFILKRLRQSGDNRAALALLMEKCEDFANSVVRQIGFSNFERQVHDANVRLSPTELNDVWLQTTQELYGPPGEVFTYNHTERLWSYVSHFHRPFYVYAYAIGELLTRTLYRLREKFGDQFEPMYLNLLRAGGTQSLTDLLRPFGENPTNPHFWEIGIETFESQIDEAIRLSAEMGISVN